ncbi:carbohydrate ABC transporter permease [Neomoorella thermoacetica]|uniref:carbohydrate ABC transporter permease n=1 Tax=Neomoorella thermoacetica TaxID=1525 RepID=UPI0030CC2902
MKDNRKAGKCLETILKHSLLLIYALIIIVPLSLVFFATFKNTAQLYSNPVGLPQQWNLSNYIQLFTSQNMFVYFKNSIIVTFTSVFFILLLGSMISYAIIRLPKVIGNLLLGFVTLGMMIPVQVNMIPTYLLLSRLKMLNTHLGLILVTIATLLPICVFILTGFMKTLPRGLIEAAMIDGASHWKIYSKIVIPLSLPSLAAAAIFCFVITWNDLLYPMLFLKTGSLRTLPVALLQFQGEYLTNYPLIFSGVVVASLPMIIIYVFLQRYFVEGMTAGSIKG